MASQSPTSTPANPRAETPLRIQKALLQKLDKHLDNHPAQFVMRLLETNLAVTSRHALNQTLLNKLHPLRPLPRSGNSGATSCSSRGGSVFPDLFYSSSGKRAALLPLPPLRTGRESFPSSGSSRSKAPLWRSRFT